MIIAFVSAIVVGYYSYYFDIPITIFFSGLLIRFVMLVSRYGIWAVLSGGGEVSTPLSISIIIMLVFLFIMIKVRSRGRVRFIRSERGESKTTIDYIRLRKTIGYLVLVIIGFLLGILWGVLSLSPYIKMRKALKNGEDEKEEENAKKIRRFINIGVAVNLASLAGISQIVLLFVRAGAFFQLWFYIAECSIMIIALTVAIFMEYFAYSKNPIPWIIFFSGLGVQIVFLVFKYIQCFIAGNTAEIEPLLSVSSLCAITGFIVFLRIRIKGSDRYFRMLENAETNESNAKNAD